jgi:flavin-binding protein dodecin
VHATIYVLGCAVPGNEDEPMTEKTFNIIELCGVSDNSYAEATTNAIAKPSETLRNLDWFEVVNQRGVIRNGKVAEFQVVLKVGFRLESGKAAD